MTKHISSILLIACVGCSAPAQSSHPADPRPSNAAPPMDPPQPGDPANCPAVQLKAPDTVASGSQARFSAIVVGGPRDVDLMWSVSAGRIVSGQHTPELVVETGGLSGASITATLALGGLSAQCATNTATASVLVGPPN